jgi:hypothetical protein
VSCFFWAKHYSQVHHSLGFQQRRRRLLLLTSLSVLPLQRRWAKFSFAQTARPAATFAQMFGILSVSSCDWARNLRPPQNPEALRCSALDAMKGWIEKVRRVLLGGHLPLLPFPPLFCCLHRQPSYRRFTTLTTAHWSMASVRDVSARVVAIFIFIRPIVFFRFRVGVEVMLICDTRRSVRSTLPTLPQQYRTSAMQNVRPRHVHSVWSYERGGGARLPQMFPPNLKHSRPTETK